jgi:hypothetical protein
MHEPIRVLIRHADALIAAGAAAALAGESGLVVVDAELDVQLTDCDGALAWLAEARHRRTRVLVLQAIRAKLEARSRTEATAIAEQRGLLGRRLALAA